MDAADVDGSTALHSAVLLGQLTTLRVLVESGASMNATSEGGSTPLHVAAVKGQEAAASALLEGWWRPIAPRATPVFCVLAASTDGKKARPGSSTLASKCG